MRRNDSFSTKSSSSVLQHHVDPALNINVINKSGCSVSRIVACGHLSIACVLNNCFPDRGRLGCVHSGNQSACRT